MSFLSHRRHVSRLLCSSVLALSFLPMLTACGGSTEESEDGYTITTLTVSPTAPTSGTPVSVAATVTTTGSIAASALTYAWTQTSGPTVTMTGADSATVYFTAPTVTSATDIVLKLTVTTTGLTANKSVTITVSP